MWNRSIDKLLDLPEEKILEDLEDIPDMPSQVLKEDLINNQKHNLRVNRAVIWTSQLFN